MCAGLSCIQVDDRQYVISLKMEHGSVSPWKLRSSWAAAGSLAPATNNLTSALIELRIVFAAHVLLCSAIVCAVWTICETTGFKVAREFGEFINYGDGK